MHQCVHHFSVAAGNHGVYQLLTLCALSVIICFEIIIILNYFMCCWIMRYVSVFVCILYIGGLLPKTSSQVLAFTRPSVLDFAN